MRFVKFLSLFLIGLLLNDLCYANPLRVVIKLVDIRVEKTLEKGGDELYFNVTRYSSLGNSENSRIPIYPSHWLSKQVPKLKNVSLWEGSLNEGEEIKFIISLIEQDFPPWDQDNGIGSASLVLQNDKGKLIENWGVPAYQEKKEVEQLKNAKFQSYVFKGAAARYDVAFKIEQK